MSTSSMVRVGACLAQANPLFRREVVRVISCRPTVWDWSVCDVESVVIEADGLVAETRSSFSSAIFEETGYVPIPDVVFLKIQRLAAVSAVAATADARREAAQGALALFRNVVQPPSSGFASDYDKGMADLLARVYDVMDVHK